MSKEAELVANQYAGYLRVDMTTGLKSLEDTVEETVTRLDEYSSLIDMVRAESNVEKCNSILARRGELDILFEKVRNLEFMVAKIKQDVYNVESLVNKAEKDFGISTEGKLRYVLKPIFARKNPMPVERRCQEKFESPDLFSAKNFFH